MSEKEEEAWMGGTHGIARVRCDAAAFEPGHVGVPECVLRETSERSHVHGARVDSRAFLQDATPFLAFEHLIEQMWEHGPRSSLSESGNHVCAMLDTNTK